MSFSCQLPAKSCTVLPNRTLRPKIPSRSRDTRRTLACEEVAGFVRYAPAIGPFSNLRPSDASSLRSQIPQIAVHVDAPKWCSFDPLRTTEALRKAPLPLSRSPQSKRAAGKSLACSAVSCSGLLHLCLCIEVRCSLILSTLDTQIGELRTCPPYNVQWSRMFLITESEILQTDKNLQLFGI